MTTSLDSQNLQAFVQVYDAVPKEWEEARPYLVEQLKGISNAINVRTIGYYLDVELLTGNLFIPGVTVPGNNPGVFRDILRFVVDLSPLIAGPNVIPVTPVVFNANFLLIDAWVAGTNTVTPPFNAQVITGANVNLVNVLGFVGGTVTSPQAFNKGFLIIEYVQTP